MGPLVVLTLRLVGPLAILRWPLGGGLLAFLLDLHDTNLIKLLGPGNLQSPLNHLFAFRYQEIDKFLDMYYLALELIVSLRWQEKLARLTSVYLFGWRLIGFIVFELTKIRAVLVFAPNVFENFFLFYLIAQKYFPRFKLTPSNLVWVLLLLGLPKIGQEYMLHILDSEPYVRFKESIWHFLNSP
jgi:hypothetical protein